ncbi:MAG TPA: DUF4124 domain-containing protein [Burkholderiales bacterium]|nr:DUF4124 domain-containing protein [Burkholderiales bacterium]
MTAIRSLFLAILVLPGLAQADMYRWVDRETGAVKFSNTPPPWYGDPEKERRNPPVEVIRYRGPVEKPKPAPEPQGAAAEARTIATLEARWLELVRFFASLPPTTDFESAGPNIKRQLDAYRALAAELDRLDPGGTARRRSQEAAVIEAVRRDLAPQPSPPRATE